MTVRARDHRVRVGGTILAGLVLSLMLAMAPARADAAEVGGSHAVEPATTAEAASPVVPSGVAGISLLLAAAVGAVWSVAASERRARPSSRR